MSLETIVSFLKQPSVGKFGRGCLILCLYIAIAAVALGANPFRGQTVGPFDLLASYQGWQPEDRQVAPPRHNERSDILDALLPSWIEAKKQLGEGNIPLWDPMRAGGGPALLNPVTILLTPAFAVFALVPDDPLGFYLATLLNMVVAGLGMHLLVRRYCGFAAATLAGASYMLCGFFTAWLYWPHIHTAMWIPWLLFSIDSYLERGEWRRVLPTSLFTGLLFLGGFPFVVAIGIGSAIVWVVAKSVLEDFRNAFPNMLGVVLGIVLGLALVSIPLLNLKDVIGGIDLGDRQYGSSLTLGNHLKLLLQPWAGQNPRVETNMYIGMLALPLAAAGGVRVFLSAGSMRTFSLVGLLLAAVGFLLTFGIFPKEIGGRLPILNSSVWSRCILLLDIGLILMAAAGLDWIVSSIRSRALALGVAGTILLLQGGDIGRQFRLFNGSTDATLYFRDNPVINELRNEMRPFQYAAQDSAAFMVSGTLEAKGISEWYAHALRSPEMQSFLQAMAPGSMTTATATRIRLDGYRWSNPLLDAAGLCYGIGPAEWQPWAVVQSTANGKRMAMPPIVSRVRQTLKLSRSVEASGVALRLATYGRSDLDGTVAAAIANARGQLVTDWVRRKGSDVVDNQMLTFVFMHPVGLVEGDYQIWLEYEPGPARRPLTVWRLVEAEGTTDNGTGRLPGTIEYALYGSSSSGLQLAMRAEKVMYARNPGCAEGPYFTPRIKSGIPEVHLGRVELKGYKPHQFVLAVSPGEPGYVVVPMQYRNGWQVTVDGNEVPVELVAGVMPAVRVDGGEHGIEFRYRPPGLLRGSLAALAAIAVLLLLYLRNWFRQPNRHDRSGEKRML